MYLEYSTDWFGPLDDMKKLFEEKVRVGFQTVQVVNALLYLGTQAIVFLGQEIVQLLLSPLSANK